MDCVFRREPSATRLAKVYPGERSGYMRCPVTRTEDGWMAQIGNTYVEVYANPAKNQRGTYITEDHPAGQYFAHGNGD